MSYGTGWKADDVIVKGDLEVDRYSSAKPLPSKCVEMGEFLGGRTLNALPVLDQSQTSTCVSQSVTEVIYARLAQVGDNPVIIDTQKAYAMAQRWEQNRRRKKSPLVDGGLHPVDMVLMLSKWGVNTIAAPYAPRDLDAHVLDDVWVADYQRAATHAVNGWRRIADDLEPAEIVEAAKQYLAAGFPGFDGADLDAGFMNYSGGVWTRDPNAKSRGLHATAIVGYDDDRQAFLRVNSWSSGWGDRGFYWQSYATYGDSLFVADRYFLDATHT